MEGEAITGSEACNAIEKYDFLIGRLKTHELGNGPSPELQEIRQKLTGVRAKLGRCVSEAAHALREILEQHSHTLQDVVPFECLESDEKALYDSLVRDRHLSPWKQAALQALAQAHIRKTFVSRGKMVSIVGKKSFPLYQALDSLLAPSGLRVAILYADSSRHHTKGYKLVDIKENRHQFPSSEDHD